MPDAPTTEPPTPDAAAPPPTPGLPVADPDAAERVLLGEAARPWWRRLGPAGPLALVATVLPPLGGIALLATLSSVGPWLQSHAVLGVMLYVVGFALLAGLALLPTYSQAILGGFAFGTALGIPAALLGFLGGSALAFTIARPITGQRVVGIVDENPRFAVVRKAMLGSGFAKTLLVVTLLRLPPNSPFALTNVALAGLRVPWAPFLLGTVLGMTPRTALAVYLGAGLADLDLSNLADSTNFFVGLAVTIAVVATLGLLAKRALRQLA